ncbi:MULTISPECIES: cysteine desulfurase family protein [unclassified Mucilaginibacter]|uniref:cysteine desulfurase family protein n=1 Tax=unclassified Mucilaginibacter TaxID=2617802 RepID=UPI002AC9D17A|nr:MULTISPECIES: cysteine desulfurase family protein [unclassified Mucilaginibacter]MEB0263650.1 cysteine desulfurase family protein [Mucilaginibacter sp. 10I4]MEB0277884.1 cysteine desulfurase family protein [Mucilaginibacter sp. 10B2]MEB0300569.1 cysteine desulfurase family protein [Mucilaginibacter sp. 5C4]WPX22775.1 cysteine desulfurase family protein [Mucilaginibacter sp. 5C4]
MRVYFDNAATTAIDPEVLKEMYKAMEGQFGNPSSIHSHGREVRTLIERSRKTIAGLLHTSPAEIFFTSGGTEADNMAIRCGIVDHKLTHAITTKLEHHAVVHTLQAMEKGGVIKLSYADVDCRGNVDYEHLETLLKINDRSFVSLMHANNELGTLTDIQRVGEICEAYNAMYHSDTVQTVGHYKHDLKKLKLHFMVCAAHKLHGPKGIGFLHINHKVKINPMIYGGSQERNMRGGTENVYGIAGLAKALEMAYADMDAHQAYIQDLKSYMKAQLEQNVPGVEFNGETDPAKSLYTVLSASFPEMEMADMLLFNLDIAGISASGGSACSSGTDIGSHVLTAIGANPNRPSVRFSFSKYNTKDEVDYVVAKLKELCMVNA